MVCSGGIRHEQTGERSEPTWEQLIFIRDVDRGIKATNKEANGGNTPGGLTDWLC